MRHRSPATPYFVLTAAAGAIALAAVCAAAFLAPAAAARARSAARSAAAHPACATSGLVLWINTQGNGAAGSVYYQLQLTNLSRHACTVRGYPGVSAVDLHGHRLGRAASREHVGKARLITLKAGATAQATLRIVNVGIFPAAACRMRTAAGLRVYPPGQHASKVIPFPFGACSRSGPVFLSVRAVQRS